MAWGGDDTGMGGSESGELYGLGLSMQGDAFTATTRQGTPSYTSRPPITTFPSRSLQFQSSCACPRPGKAARSTGQQPPWSSARLGTIRVTPDWLW
jgi:hypothetical protein